MNAASIIADWKRRLLALAENPPYVFRDTPRYLIDQHERRLTTFAGYGESEVAEAEARLHSRFPDVFREYLLRMAKSTGDLFRNSELAGPDDFERFREDAVAMLAKGRTPRTLPPEATVFMWHQDRVRVFMYLPAAGGFDSPVMQWSARGREPKQVAASFAAMVDAELGLMEDANRRSREDGGYYLTLYPGGAAQSYPSLASGDRPLGPVDRPDRGSSH